MREALVAPSRGAWIETPPPSRLLAGRRRRPPRGGVDRNKGNGCYAESGPLSPLLGGVDRNVTEAEGMPRMQGRHPRAGVDRNTKRMASSTLMKPSPPRMGVDRNALIAARCGDSFGSPLAGGVDRDILSGCVSATGTLVALLAGAGSKLSEPGDYPAARDVAPSRGHGGAGQGRPFRRRLPGRHQCHRRAGPQDRRAAGDHRARLRRDAECRAGLGRAVGQHGGAQGRGADRFALCRAGRSRHRRRGRSSGSRRRRPFPAPPRGSSALGVIAELPMGASLPKTAAAAAASSKRRFDSAAPRDQVHR